MSKVTLSLLKKIFPKTPDAKLRRFVEPFNTILPKYGVTTKKRFAAFVGTAGVESDYLKTTIEYASGAAYEGRKDLGNVLEGDGKRFRGHGIFQNTGRWNHWKVVVAYLRVLTNKNWADHPLATGKTFREYLKTKHYDDMLKEADKYNVNFLANPEKLAETDTAVEAAGVFIVDNGLNAYADRGNFKGYSGIVNKGSPRATALHYDRRLDVYDKALEVIPNDFELTEVVEKPLEKEPDIIIDAEVKNETVTETVVEQLDGKEITTETTTSETKVVEAPAKEGAVGDATKMTIAGIVVPPTIAVILKSIGDLISQGYVETKEIGTFVFSLISNNLKWVFLLIGLIILLLIVRKAFKQITLLYQMKLAGDKNSNDVVVKAG